jgi:uncharacterized membrane protein YoaK (UPF0700 family)
VNTQGLAASGAIRLGEGVWPNLGAEGSHLLAQMFGSIGIERIFNDNPNFKTFVIVIFCVGAVVPFFRAVLPARVRVWLPNTVMIGLPQFAPGFAYSIASALALSTFYQHLKKKRSEWYRKYQMLSTSGLNMGVGIGGLALLIAQLITTRPMSVHLGGPAGDGCYFPPNMPQF